MESYIPNKKILFLDDEINVLKSLSRLISRFGFEASITTDPNEALTFLEKEPFGVIVSDYRMPQMVGTDFLTQTKVRSPNSIRILLTGYADIGAAIQAVNKSGIFKYLTKPWDEEQIRETLTDALKQFNLAEENMILQNEIKLAATKLKDINENLNKIVDQRTFEIQQLNKKLESTFLGSIKLMGSVAHIGEPQISEHCRRVALLATEIAKDFSWRGRDLFEIQVAGYLHDIADSFEVSKPDHALKGHELISMIPNLGKAYDYVLYHHEHMNGHDESGTNIPLGARIISVVDAYDEALNLTPSSVSATPNKVILAIREQSPQKFDGRVVAALFNYLKRNGKLNDEDYETTVSIITLTPGMILSKNLYAKSGKLILAKDNMISEDYLARIFKKHVEDPIDDEIFVYKNSMNDYSTRRI